MGALTQEDRERLGRIADAVERPCSCHADKRHETNAPCSSCQDADLLRNLATSPHPASSSQPVAEEAVELATRAAWEPSRAAGWDHATSMAQDDARDRIRRALQAAAPSIEAAALERERQRLLGEVRRLESESVHMEDPSYVRTPVSAFVAFRCALAVNTDPEQCGDCGGPLPCDCTSHEGREPDAAIDHAKEAKP